MKIELKYYIDGAPNSKEIKLFTIEEPQFVKHLVDLFILNGIISYDTDDHLDRQSLTICVVYNDTTKKTLRVVHDIILNLVYGEDHGVLKLEDLPPKRVSEYHRYARFIKTLNS